MVTKGRLSGWLRRKAGERDADGEDALAQRTPGARDRDDLLLAAAEAGLPLALAAHPSAESGYRCSCDRIGCPTPGRHPVSFAWQTQATTDPEAIRRWLRTEPLANFITATGIAHDVLDVPAEAGRIALERLAAEGAATGPVAVSDGRTLFFTGTRATADEDEWWPCELDCHPETLDEHPGLRWHCRASYVLMPPSRLPSGAVVTWLPGHGPDRPLPDPLPLLAVLTDACAQVEHEPETAGWIA
ncbi:MULTISPECIES: bifunctional DNA primase/polymerase [unclassified Streptomyces]|uniref:bifunctional DNA primase/polymerase n=1 Tax=unclassified Streptomyces TaxID=2593676 RepID=UPI0038067BFF